MYQKRYYYVKWSKLCEEKWKEYDQSTKEGETKKARITFINELSQGFLDAEPSEVQEEIDGLMARQAKGETFLLKEDGDEADDEGPDEKRQMAERLLTEWNK